LYLIKEFIELFKAFFKEYRVKFGVVNKIF